MVFEKEDRAAWENSEVMKELEDIACKENLLSKETEEEVWEEEEEKEEVPQKKEVVEDGHKEEELINNLLGLASIMNGHGLYKEAWAVELAAREINGIRKTASGWDKLINVGNKIVSLSDELEDMGNTWSITVLDGHLRNYWGDKAV